MANTSHIMAKSWRYLFVEVQESLGTVDIVEGRHTRDDPVDRHGVDTQNTPRCHEEPMRVRTTYEHLGTQ